MFSKHLIHNFFLILMFCDHLFMVSSLEQQNNIDDGDMINNVTTVIPRMITNKIQNDQRIVTTKIIPKLLIDMINESSNTSSSSNYSSHKIENQKQATSSEPYIFINGRSVTASDFSAASFIRSHVMIDINSSRTYSNHSSTLISTSINNCIEGKSYWNHRTGKCQDCMSKCPSGAMVSRPCNRTHNLECNCTKGSYMSIVDGTCKPCSECPLGYGVWRTCKLSRNTVCRQCHSGTYSGVALGMVGCIPCSKCGPNQEMISGCDGYRDSVCIDRSVLVDSYLNTIDDGQEQEDMSTYNGPESSLSSSPNFDRIQTYQNGHGLPFYIAMLVIIVFTFCIYALIQLRCNNSLMLPVDHRVSIGSRIQPHSHHTKLLPPQTSNIITNVNLQRSPLVTTSSCPHHHSYNVPAWISQTSSPTDISPYQSTISPLHFHDSAMPSFPAMGNNNCKFHKTSRKFHRPMPTSKYANKTYYELLLGPNNSITSTPISNDSMGIQSVPLISDDVEHLTIEIRQALENLLGKDSEMWRLLARELGYDEQHIVQFEAKATTMSNGRTMIDTFKAIRLLLLDWSSQMTTSPDDNHHSSKTALSLKHQGNSGPPSLATLSNALIRIGRLDCARVVLRQNYHQQQNQTIAISSSRQ